MADFIYVPNKAGMSDLMLNPAGPVGRHLTRLGNRLERYAKQDVGKKTRTLERSIHSRLTMKSTGLVVMVGSENRIALMHHEGTRPHIIVPKRAHTLVFRSNGTIVFAKKVNHPGTRPNRYLSNNLARVVLSN